MKIQEEKLIYPELSYQIVGYLYDVHNKIGGGHKEKYIQRAIEILLQDNKVNYQKELFCPLVFNGQTIGKYFLDFLIEDKIILEIKVGERFDKKSIDQVFSYLKVNKLKLGILAQFTKEKVRFRRILNLR